MISLVMQALMVQRVALVADKDSVVALVASVIFSPTSLAAVVVALMVHVLEMILNIV